MTIAGNCLGALLGLVGLGACVVDVPYSKRSLDAMAETQVGYGVVTAVVPSDDARVRKLCALVKNPGIVEKCSAGPVYKGVLLRWAASSRQSALNAGVFVPTADDVQKGDIVKFRWMRDQLQEFIHVVSRGERADCKWTGSAAWTIGFPAQSGGIECEGWSYKTILARFDALGLGPRD